MLRDEVERARPSAAVDEPAGMGWIAQSDWVFARLVDSSGVPLSAFNAVGEVTGVLYPASRVGSALSCGGA